jgi:hypothetical protein
MASAIFRPAITGSSASGCAHCRHVLRHGRCYPARQGAEQLGHVDRLGDEIVHPGVQAFFLVAHHGIGSHGDHWQAGITRILAQLARRLVAIHHRHLAIHQHAVIGIFLDLGQRDGAIARDIDADAGIVENMLRHFLVHLIVLHQQQPGTAQARSSSR